MEYIIKTCKKCGEHKQLDCFYTHKAMKDGHLNFCIDCVRDRISKREQRLRLNTEWYEKEKERHRDKYHRLEYKEKHKPTPQQKKITMESYFNRYPEKAKAQIKSQHIKTNIKGNHKHHWSYNEEHYKDVIELTPKEHALLHRHIIYDQERMMYRNLKGVLLDTKESHLKLLGK
jgi:hypothetical protein